MLRKIFLDHPAEVGESYFQHFAVAGSIGLALIRGGLGALVHAFIPSLCQTTGSDTIARLYKRLVTQRAAKRAAGIEMATSEWII